MAKIQGKKIAILATDGFEHSELFEPQKAIKDAGGQVDIISLEKGEIKSWKDGNWGETIKVDKTVDEVTGNDYDGLVLPGGVINPDKLRINTKAIEFIKSFFSGNKQKPVAAICHGPWTLIDADVVKGRKVTSWKSIRKDLENAGAKWVDEEVVVDNGLVTSRNPGDLKAFNNKIIEEVSEGVHA